MRSALRDIHARRDLIDPHWIDLELDAVLEEVNRERGARRLPPITKAQLEARERSAQGHSDYARKLALYCAELILDISHRP